MFNFENVTNTKGAGILKDLELFSQNKLRIGTEAAKKIGLDIDTKDVLIQRDKTSGKFFIAAVDKESGVGKSVNDNKGKLEFTHVTLHTLLGGKHSEWEIVGEGTEFQGITYFELQQTVDGAAERAKLATKEVEEQADTVEEVQNEVVEQETEERD